MHLSFLFNLDLHSNRHMIKVKMLSIYSSFSVENGPYGLYCHDEQTLLKPVGMFIWVRLCICVHMCVCLNLRGGPAHSVSSVSSV